MKLYIRHNTTSRTYNASNLAMRPIGTIANNRRSERKDVHSNAKSRGMPIIVRVRKALHGAHNQFVTSHRRSTLNKRHTHLTYRNITGIRGTNKVVYNFDLYQRKGTNQEKDVRYQSKSVRRQDHLRQRGVSNILHYKYHDNCHVDTYLHTSDIFLPTGNYHRHVRFRNSLKVIRRTLSRSLKNTRLITTIRCNRQETRADRRRYLFRHTISSTRRSSKLIPRRRAVTNNTVQCTIAKVLNLTKGTRLTMLQANNSSSNVNIVLTSVTTHSNLKKKTRVSTHSVRVFSKYTRELHLVTRAVRRFQSRGTIERAKMVLRNNNISRLATQHRLAHGGNQTVPNTYRMSYNHVSNETKASSSN